MFFTSPSSARGNLDEEEVPEPWGKQRKTTSKRPSNGTKLKMDGQVTARAIAYAAVQVFGSLRRSLGLAHLRLSFTSHSMMRTTGWAITMVLTTRNSMSSLPTFSKRTRHQKERLPPVRFSIGGTGMFPIQDLSSLSLMPPRRVFPRSAATRAASSTSARRSSLAVVRRQRQARSSR